MRDRLRLAQVAWTALLCGCSVLAGPPPPASTRTTKTRWAEQGWSQETRNWFHHAEVGTSATGLSLKWFKALEQPVLWPAEQPLLTDPTYLKRFGFLPDPDSPEALPVGFIPSSGNGSTRTVALGCAACHTGQLEYRRVSFRFDGGAALIDLAGFERALAQSLVLTAYLPGRFARAAERIVGHAPDADDEQRLKAELEVLSDAVIDEFWRRRGTSQVKEGFGRLDATARLASGLFPGPSTPDPPPYAGPQAPVSYPPLWDTPWFDWSQYNGSLAGSLFQSASHALGFLGAIDAPGRPTRPLDTQLHGDTLTRLDTLLAGEHPPRRAGGFTGLRAPQWPESLLGKIDRKKSSRGERLYDTLCMRCHLPPPDREDFFDSEHWQPADPLGRRFLKLPDAPLQTVGTDDRHARTMQGLRVTLSAGQDGEAEVPYAEGLKRITQRALARTPLPAEQRSRALRARAPTAYRARPLDGVWATAPYLHNGSVPTLFALLSPLAQRPERFSVGSRRFDPRRVGYEVEPRRGDFLFDTQKPGNSNAGHLFDDTPGPGVLGRRLSEVERYQLIEFLKTLNSRRLPVGAGQPPPPRPASLSDPLRIP